MVHEHVLVVLLCVSAAFGAPLNKNYFRCHLDLCKRGEQYCVEERQRCYHCADSAHLCNTTELTRDCDSYCYRVQLQALVELEANKSAELADRQADLQYEQQKNADLKQTLKELTSSISRLTNLNKNLNADVTKGENLKTEHKEVVKQLKQSRNNFVIVCTVAGTLVFIVILLAGALCCLYCRDKGHSRLIDITQQETMVHEHVLVVLLCVSAAFGAPLNKNYFRCHLDLCKRGEQYCVEERQRCYHCADSAHLCNTTELTRDCDSYCYRVQLQALVELEANKSAELADRQADLQYEQQKNADLKQTLKELTSSISRLTNLNKNLNADVTKGENLKTEHKEVVKQLKQSRNNFVIVCTVAGTLVFIVILLAGALCCLYCRGKGHSRSIDITQQGEIKEAKGSDLVPLMDRSNNCPGITINGDFTVSRLEVQSPDKTIDNDINSTPPPVYQSRIEAKEDIIDITVTDKNDINQRENERTPSVLKNIQPTDSYSGNKDPTDPLNQILITDNRG